MAPNEQARKHHDELFPGHESTLAATDPELICFGDHYTRTGLDLPTRELLTFAMLIAMGGCEPQAKGHVAANLNVGNDRRTLLSLVTQLLPFIGYPRTLNAVRLINEVIPAPAAQ